MRYRNRASAERDRDPVAHCPNRSMHHAQRVADRRLRASDRIQHKIEQMMQQRAKDWNRWSSQPAPDTRGTVCRTTVRQKLSLRCAPPEAIFLPSACDTSILNSSETEFPYPDFNSRNQRPGNTDTKGKVATSFHPWHRLPGPVRTRARPWPSFQPSIHQTRRTRHQDARFLSLRRTAGRCG